MGFLKTDKDTQEAINLAHDLFDKGYPFVDEHGNQFYGQDARDKLSDINLAGQGCLGILILPALLLLALAALL